MSNYKTNNTPKIRTAFAMQSPYLLPFCTYIIYTKNPHKKDPIKVPIQIIADIIPSIIAYKLTF